MTTGIVDTTVLIHLYRNNSDALAWIGTWKQPLTITSITWLELMIGAAGKAGQTRCKAVLGQFNIIYLSQVDQEWAMDQIERYRLSHDVSINDCLIAAVAHRLRVPLYTHNIKDMRVLLGDMLPQKPY